MTQQEIFEGLREVITTVKPKLDLSGATLDSSLVRDLGMDSLSMLLVSLATEQKFGMRFDGKEIFNTVGDVVKCIESKI